MAEDNRRNFLKVAAVATVAPFATYTQAAPPVEPPTPASGDHTLVMAITGDLRHEPVFLADVRPGVPSDPIHLEGNGTYRVAVTPVQDHPAAPMFRLVLSDANGTDLADMTLGTNTPTLFQKCGVAVFAKYGVMIYLATVPAVTGRV
jgi:hypothetical protein